MQLQPGEMSILAYFPNQESAAGAAAQLKSLGFNDTQLNKLNSYARTGAGSVPRSISALTAAGENPEHYRSYGPLLASSTFASGMAADDTAYFTYMVTVVSDAARISEAQSVIRAYGGRA